jgi:hypothetical protein
MAQYLILIYSNEAQLATASAADFEQMMKAHQQFGQANGHALRGGARLADSDAATSIRTDDAGVQTVADGMFPETKEVLGGYYVIEAADLDEAIAIAKQVPTVAGGVEVRPIVPS